MDSKIVYPSEMMIPVENVNFQCRPSYGICELNCDGAWHSLDLATKGVPKNIKAASIYLGLHTYTAGSQGRLSRFDQLNNNEVYLSAIVSGNWTEERFVLPFNGLEAKLNYKFSDVSWYIVSLIIYGYWL